MTSWSDIALFTMPNLIEFGLIGVTASATLLFGGRQLRWVGLALVFELLLVIMIPTLKVGVYASACVGLDLAKVILFSLALLSTPRTWPIFAFGFAFASLPFTGMQWMLIYASVWESGRLTEIGVSGKSLAFFGAMQMLWSFALHLAVLSGVGGDLRRHGWRASLPSIAVPARVQVHGPTRPARALGGAR